MYLNTCTLVIHKRLFHLSYISYLGKVVDTLKQSHLGLTKKY